jgi:hypothetical protein
MKSEAFERKKTHLGCHYEQGEYERGPHSRAEARESKSVWLYFGLYA